jgi:hypothetical protein
MIDTWLKNDLNLIFDKYTVAVLIDESGDAEFLLRTISNEYTLYTANSEIEELYVKYLIEREQPSSKKYLIYTHTARDNLKFVREYCETNGCLEIRYLQNYIKDKVHQALNLNINLPKDELITAAKVSIGKDKGYWFDVCHKGATEIFDLKKELLPFIHNPAAFEAEKYDAQLRETFYRKVNDLLKQEYIQKPAQTLASEVVKVMLDGLVLGTPLPILEAVYNDWLDSVSYRDSFSNYICNYTLPADVDIWAVNSSHPFRSIDEQWLRIIGENLGNKESLPNYLDRVSKRNQSKQAKALGITFWSDVKVLLEFDPKDMAYLSSFSECVEFYTKHFYTLDTAIRNLYTEFLNKANILDPLQAHYKQLTVIFLDKWFKYFTGYQEQQTGILQHIIDENSEKTAVIVGDGVAYEMACQVAAKVNSGFKVTKNILLADIPSETENNMSRIYMANGATEEKQSDREEYLRDQNPSTAIDFIKLDQVNEEPRPSKYLICTYKDIDDMGEKLQHKALKYFPEAIDYFSAKISILLKSGYEKVYLITDHGFVLTGLLSESDKISVSLDGAFEKAERYIHAVDRQPSLTSSCMETEKKYGHFNYLYISTTMNPFRTPGVYGFSHGGAAPQELITPYFCWERSDDSSQALTVIIQNKDELKSVTGELFQLKIQADKNVGDLFSLNRKVYLVFFSNKAQINKSDVFIIQREELIAKEFTFDGNTEIEVHLLDAQTKAQLDKIIIKQSKDRDLGSLFNS